MKIALLMRSFGAVRSRAVAKSQAFHTATRSLRLTLTIVAASVAAIFPGVVSARAACATFGQGVGLGVVSIAGVREISGIAASRRNPSVLWIHDDGSAGVVHAVGMNGARLATFYLGRAVVDTEDIAVGPGPVAGMSYLYVGDIGGNKKRREVRILRIPEPIVEPGWAGNPITVYFSGVEAFTVSYPDGKYNAESLMVDPFSGSVFVVTKHDTTARVYCANLNYISAGVQARWTFVTTVPFSRVTGGDISADGMRIVLRSEDYARTWERFKDEEVGTALSRQGIGIPVIGQPVEPKGEGIALLPNGTGYVTISEGVNPVIYSFESQCPVHPRIAVQLRNKRVVAGRKVILGVRATGYPEPTYRWRFNGEIIPGATSRMLVLRKVTAADEGEYMVTAWSSSGRVASKAILTVLP